MRDSCNRAAVSPNPREAVSGWVLEAVFPNGKQATITGFGTESEATEWLGSARHVAWLRDTRTAFSLRAVAATFDYYAAILTAAACDFLQSARQGWHDLKEAQGEYQTTGTTLAPLRALALACLAGLTHGAGKWGRAGWSKAVRWRSIVCRCLVVATGALLIVGAVVAILAALLMPLGRSKQPVGLGAGTPPMSAAAPVVPVRSSEVTPTSDPIAVLIERVSSADIVAEPRIEAAAQDAPPPVQDDGAAPESPAATPPHDVHRAAPLGIVGVWAPETSSCTARNARDGVLPAIISDHGARAGATSCVFKNQRRSKSDWRLLANCTNGREHWRSNVRLAVKGDRLIWTSERGTQAYIRCRHNV